MKPSKRSPGPQGEAEMVALNRESIDFDLDSVSVEELERRFELALASSIVLNKFCGCPNLKSCGTFCSPPPP